jgi:FAD/FMN-containing dehydrogenase
MPARFPTKQLEQRLRRAIRGEVRFDNGSRALYSTDSSNYRQIPIGVVIPRTEADVVETVAICREFGVPITGRGGGTSLAGQCCNRAVIIDFSKYLNRLIQFDPDRKIVRAEPGIIYDHVNRAVAKYRLAFAPDPSA